MTCSRIGLPVGIALEFMTRIMTTKSHTFPCRMLPSAFSAPKNDLERMALRAFVRLLSCDPAVFSSSPPWTARFCPSSPSLARLSPIRDKIRRAANGLEIDAAKVLAQKPQHQEMDPEEYAHHEHQACPTRQRLVNPPARHEIN